MFLLRCFALLLGSCFSSRFFFALRIAQDKLREKILGAEHGGRSAPLLTGVREGRAGTGAADAAREASTEEIQEQGR